MTDPRKPQSHKDLTVWQKAMDLVEDIYRITRDFPDEERFGLVQQMRRCAVSIPSNIAEGAGRSSSREFLRFLSIAIGSLAELETQVEIAKRIGYLSEVDSFEDRIRFIRSKSGSLFRSIKKRISDEKHKKTTPEDD